MYKITKEIIWKKTNEQTEIHKIYILWANEIQLVNTSASILGKWRIGIIAERYQSITQRRLPSTNTSQTNQTKKAPSKQAQPA